ncbi:CvfB family protein [[Clostridium] polysaccharolyticum]|jgi:hypothetical protein|uniref:S1 motif domain-containing protein n=1 Tax=[Clostridium] polysaccharolyticum TaxID=29364 RepID=A0A1I0FWP5_9FIRM|nr:S1-like domain-containing RNA-binding protein [[Clostridium] polysaccharolyticum]SET62923.1 hypothetical protein SAMN04487772_14012 [[Clostridium] polysaccharolyticum]
MLQIGKIQTLEIAKETKFGLYLIDPDGNAKECVLLPKGETTPEMQVGETVSVYIYRDSEDRVIATTKFPPMELGDTCILTVKEVNNIGAFLDWGLTKDLFLPYKQQTRPLKAGQQILVALYLDKSSRLCATMKVYEYLKNNAPYQKDDRVNGVVYEIIESFGAYVAVDNKYSAMIPNKELHKNLRPGELITARVTNVKEDGRLDLSLQEKAFVQMDSDALIIYRELMKSGGYLPLHDKSSPDEIKEHFQMSKNAFKRAIGRLYKDKKIEIKSNGIYTVK